MSVLDELKREAESVKAKEEQQRSSEEADTEAALKLIRPAMRQLYEYLKEMTENLSVVQPDVRAEYDVTGFGRLSGLRQTGYRISTPDNRLLEQLTLHFVCSSEGAVRFTVKGKEAAERQRQYMWEHNLRFNSKSLVDGSGAFILETHVPVTFEFRTVPDQGLIRLRLRNLDVLGSSTISYKPSQLDEGFLEELAKAVLRKPNRFNELSGNTLSEEARNRLRKQLAHDGLKKLDERRVPASSSETGVAERKKGGLLKGLFGKGAR